MKSLKNNFRLNTILNNLLRMLETETGLSLFLDDFIEELPTESRNEFYEDMLDGKPYRHYLNNLCKIILNEMYKK